MRIFIVASLAACCALAPIQSNAQSPQCNQFNEAISASLSVIGKKIYDGINDDSAPRATLRHLQIENEIGFIGLNIQLMSAAKCTPWKTPFRGFLVAKDNCERALVAKVRGSGTDSELSEACDPLLNAGKAGTK